MFLMKIIRHASWLMCSSHFGLHVPTTDDPSTQDEDNPLSLMDDAPSARRR